MADLPAVPRLKPAMGEVRARDLKVGDIVFSNDYPADILENRPSRIFGPDWRVIVWGVGDLDAALVHADTPVCVALLAVSP